MTFGKTPRPVVSGTPKKVLYAGKFTGINGASPTTYKLDPGVTVARSGEGVWVVTLPRPIGGYKAILCQATDNDGQVHDLQYTSSVANRTVTLTHKTATYAVADTSQKPVAAYTRITDVSTASSAYCNAPVAGTVTAIYSALGGAIATANDAITTAIQPFAGGGFVAITGGSWTVAFSGSAAGDADSATPSAANTVAAGDTLRVTTDGASDNAVALDVCFVITPTAAAGVVVEDVIDEISFLIVAEESDVPGAGV